jgi:hypothetical protein
LAKLDQTKKQITCQVLALVRAQICSVVKNDRVLLAFAMAADSTAWPMANVTTTTATLTQKHMDHAKKQRRVGGQAQKVW